MVAGQAVRLLVVSAQQSVRDEVAEALAGWSGGLQLFWVAQPDLAPARAQELVPHAVLVDADSAGLGLQPLIRDLVARVPNAALLVMVEEEAIDQARQAVLAGARGFVMLPLRPDDLASTLRQTLAAYRPPAREPEAGAAPPGRIIAFCAPKGGTGRTTLAINTAISLRRQTGESVALVDADYAAPAIDVALNLHADRNVTDLLPRLSRLDEDLVAGVLVPHASGVAVLLAPPPADLSSPISLPQVQSILVVLRRMFTWVIVDLGLPLDDTAYAFLDGADRIIMSVLPEMVGLRNTRLMLDRLLDRGYPDEKVWLVLNRATMNGGVSARDIEQRLRMRLTHLVPDDQPLATYSINRGVPLTASHQRSAVSRAIHKLAEHLAQERAAEMEEKAPEGARRRPFLSLRSAGD